MRKSTFSAALFDLDGTLVDSLRDIAESMNEVLATHGFPVHPIDAYRHFVGDGMDTLARRVLPPTRAEDERIRSGVVQEMKRIYAGRWRDHAFPYPGMVDLLRALADRRVILGVLSNKPDVFTREMVDFVFPDIPWATVRGSLPDVPLKPAPDAALAIACAWGVDPSGVLYVGDTSTDMLTATAAGMFPLGVTWGFRDRSELIASGAQHLAEHPREILSFFAT